MVGPMTILADPSAVMKRFSGEMDGPETRSPVVGFGTNQSTQKSAASLKIG